MLQLRQNSAVDLRVVLRSAGDPCELAARHDHDLAALALHESALFLVRGFNIAESLRGTGGELVGLSSADDLSAHRFGLGDRALDQLFGGIPVEAHPPL